MVRVLERERERERERENRSFPSLRPSSLPPPLPRHLTLHFQPYRPTPPPPSRAPDRWGAHARPNFSRCAPDCWGAHVRPNFSQCAPDRWGAYVRPNFTFKDAILTLPPFFPTLPPPPPPRPRASNLTLPLHPPKFLLNPTLKGCYFKCFARGHHAVRCKEPRRCIFCMQVGHPASRCPSHRPLPQATIEPDPSSGRPRSAAAFLPSLTSQPSLSCCVAKVDTLSMRTDFVMDALPHGLAARFGRASRDYKVAIFFPNWVVRESAIVATLSGLKTQFFGSPTGWRSAS